LSGVEIMSGFHLNLFTTPLLILFMYLYANTLLSQEFPFNVTLGLVLTPRAYDHQTLV